MNSFAGVPRETRESVRMKRKQSTAQKSSKRPLKKGFGRPTHPFLLQRANIPASLASKSPELKALDVPAGTVSLNQTGSVTALNLIRVGSTFCNRIGRKIEMKSLRIVGAIAPIRTVAAQDYVRIMLVYDRQANGALPALADVIQTTDQATTNSTSSFSGINLNNRDRFVMLRDHHVTLPSATYTAGVITNPGFSDPVSRTFNIDDYIKLGSLVTQYKADSAPAVIGDIASGSILLVTVGAAVAGQEGFNFQLETRLRYRDV